MSKILIPYRLFRRYSKFARKLKKIISNLEDVKLLYAPDPDGLIVKFSQQLQLVSSSHEIEKWSANDVTNAVVFDEGFCQNEWLLFAQAIANRGNGFVILLNPPALPLLQGLVASDIDLNRLIIIETSDEAEFVTSYIELKRAARF